MVEGRGGGQRQPAPSASPERRRASASADNQGCPAPMPGRGGLESRPRRDVLERETYAADGDEQERIARERGWSRSSARKFGERPRAGGARRVGRLLRHASAMR